ncbi:hypothetical protein LAU42_08925 [Macrococcus armenti]|uniref:hypothetical protein n=1 Tax=Macrococcus armenti TaxID=2875764 RepID=UPI001CCC2BC2|nr:hypothetical protein [Macrococcus armenti]UBH21889.1 hypothetical protein LAU42_08925 [Macrococcus armenti]
MKNLTLNHLIKAQDEESLEAFVNMLNYGLDADAAIFAICHGQWYYLDGVPTDNKDAAEWLFYHYNFYDEDSDAESDIPELAEAIDRGEWLIGKGKHESIIISTW